MTKQKKTETATEETTEALPEPSVAQKLDAAIRAKAHSLMQTTIADLWRFVEKPDSELDPEVIGLLARMEIGKPRPTLEGDLVGPLLRALDHEMRSKVRVKPAPQLKTFGPFVTGNARTDGFFPE